MNQQKIKWDKKYILIVFIGLCLVITFLIFNNREKSNTLIFEGSPEYIKKSDEQKKQLTIGVTNPPQESKSYLGQDQTSRLTKRLVYEPIVYIKKDLSIEFMLADKIIFSKDGLEAKVELNKKAKFSNGDVVNAETVKKSYLELNKTTSQYSQKDICKTIKGMEDYQLGKNNDISGIIIDNEYELTFQFNSCSILNIQGLSIPIFKTVENSKWAIGTGEYAFEKYSHNKSIELKKNLYKHTSKYAFEKIIIKGTSTIERKNEVDKFNLDICEVSLTSHINDIKEAKYHNVYEVNEAFHLNYLEFNLNDKVGENKDIRKTIYYSINKSDLQQGFDKNERMNNCQLSSLNNEKSLETYDLDIAKKAYHNVKNIKEIEYYTLGDTVSALRYDMMNKNLKEVGLNLKKTSQYDATLRYTTHQLTSPILDFEESIMNSSLKESYQTFIQSSYQNNCQNILKDFEDYCHNEYVTVPISTVAYGLAISSDVDQDSVRDLMINS